MPHFLIKKEEINGNFVELSAGENFFHLAKSLRAKAGDKIKFIDENRIVYETVVAEVSGKFLKAEILSKKESQRLLRANLCLVQSVLMSDAQNLAIANATQAGIKEIFPVYSDNVAQSRNSFQNKLEKWQKIVRENFKQCERADLPVVHEISDLKDALLNFDKKNTLIFAEKFENSNLNNCLENCCKDEKIAIVIGPEGGFSDAEFEFFKKENYKLITLGKMIYKAPNAVIAAISNVASRIEDDVQ